MSINISTHLIGIANEALQEITTIHSENQEGVSLEKARLVLAKTSAAILALFHLRQIDSGLIANAKKGGEAILDMQREFAVIKGAGDKAIEAGLDSRLTETLMWMITAMSKEVQRVLLKRDSVFILEKLNPEQGRGNLLELTRRIAPEYANYGRGFNATKITHVEELAQILNIADGLSGTMIDLGTANGYVAKAIAKQGGFEKLFGYDISPDMIAEAQKEMGEKERYLVHDLTNGIPHEDGSIDFLVASFGSAGEVHPNILKEVSRVLKRGGKAWLSFCNKDAFAHEVWQPQMNTLEIVINPLANIAEVPVWNETTKQFDIFKIPAILKSAREVREEARQYGLSIQEIQSFPLLIATVPPSFFDNDEKTQDAIIRDRALGKAEPFSGYYLNTLLHKE